MKRIAEYSLLLEMTCSCTRFVNDKHEREENENDGVGFNITHLTLKDTVIAHYVKKYLGDFHDDLDEEAITIVKYTDTKIGSDYYIS